MESILTEEMINKYVTKEIKMKGRIFHSIFKFKQIIEDTTEYTIGFREGSREFTSSIFVPTIDNGMIRRNSNLWYPVYLVVPPLYFKNKSGMVGYMKSLLNDSMMCSSAVDFMPELSKTKLTPTSLLMKECLSPEPADITDLYQWNVIGLAMAIIEIFNQKLIYQISRSMNKSYAGCSGLTKAIHTLINAMTRYYGDGESGIYADAIDTDEEILSNSLSRDDKKGVLLIHSMIKQTDISGTNPVDFCSCSQSLPMMTARIKSGVSVQNAKFSGMPDFPYAEYRRAIPGILHDDPHRVIVSRAISRAMVITSSSEPYVSTEVKLGLDTTSLPGILMTDPLNMEDAIVVSSTFAKQMGAYKILIDKFTYPSETYEVEMNIKESEADDLELYAMVASGYYSTKEANVDISKYNETIVRPGSKIGVVRFMDPDGEMITKDIISENKVPAVVAYITSYDMSSDLKSDMMTYKVTYMSYLPLMVGSKISDLHGNKATVSEIIPDDKMPLWNGEVMHYIATPYIMKRLAVGAEVEDKLALIGKQMRETTGKSLVISSNKVYPISSLDSLLAKKGISYTGEVSYQGKTYSNVPKSLRMMVRLDNNPDESLVTKSDIVFAEDIRISKNSKLGLDLVTLVARGANNLVNEFIQQSGNRKYFISTVIPMMNAIAGKLPEGAECYEITERIDRAIIGSPISNDMMFYTATAAGKIKREFTNTVCDPRCMSAYGLIKYKDQTFIVPPHDSFVNMSNGLVMVDKLAVMANRLLAEIISEQKTSFGMSDVRNCISRYQNTLAGMLSGKNGMIRESILPVMRRSIRAVLSPYIGDSITEICIPKSEFKRLCRKDETFKEFYDNKNLCMLKRDPVHRSNNFISVSFKLWDKSTIGVHPALIKILDGDYDGDQSVVAFPSSTLGYNDLHKLSPDMSLWFKGGKQLTGVNYEEVTTALEQNRGWSSTFNSPHASDVVKNPELLDILKSGMNMDVASKTGIKAAQDFCIIKDGTALTGALGLRFIFTRAVTNKPQLSGAMELYHSMAQCTLDAKSGAAVPSLDIVSAFTKGSTSQIVKGMKALGFTDIDTIEDLISFSKATGGFDNVISYMVDKYPVLAAVQRKLSFTEMLKISERCLSREAFSNGGVMEKLYDYIMDRDVILPFEYTFNINDVYDQAKFNHPNHGSNRNIA